MTDDKLRKELEDAFYKGKEEMKVFYERMKTFLLEKDYDSFYGFMKDFSKKMGPEAEAQLPNKDIFIKELKAALEQDSGIMHIVLKMFKDVIDTDMKSFKFIKTEVKGDRAGYYYRGDSNDPNYITVGMLKFRKHDAEWKFSPKFQTYSFAKRSDDAENTEEMEKLFETQEEFRL